MQGAHGVCWVRYMWMHAKGRAEKPRRDAIEFQMTRQDQTLLSGSVIRSRVQANHPHCVRGSVREAEASMPASRLILCNLFGAIEAPESMRPLVPPSIVLVLYLRALQQS